MSGMRVSRIVGATGMICGLVAIGTAFLRASKATALVHTLMGVAALGTLLAIVLTEVLPLQGEYFRTLIVVREGLYLYVMAAVVLIVAGPLQRRQR